MTTMTTTTATTTMTPREIVRELNQYIIGQEKAKRAVAIALRNRWRRMQLDEVMRSEVMPKNILMIGPTGVGKTEIARRLAKLANAPLIKVEATKFTEVGYVGRDVESIIRDLVDVAVKMNRKKLMGRNHFRAEEIAEERILDALQQHPDFKANSRQELQTKLRNGELNGAEIELNVSNAPVGIEIMTPPGMEGMAQQIHNAFKNIGSNQQKRRRKLSVSQARKILGQEESQKMIDEEDLKSGSIHDVEQKGIVFLDEIDKVTKRSGVQSLEVSREGVQRDLLPLVEGCTVTTKYGAVQTDHILFIASGAFHTSKPSDLIPELQGRFPIRVELNALDVQDFVRILTEPNYSLTRQYTALLGAEDVEIEFQEDGVRRIAEIAFGVNEDAENIGARRLHTVLEYLLDDLLFSAPDISNTKTCIDAAYVDNQLTGLIKDKDLARYIL